MTGPKRHKQLAVIAEVQRHGDIARAAKKAMVGRRTVYYWMQMDEGFKKAMDDALEVGRA